MTATVVVTDTMFRGYMQQAMDGCALNDEQARLLFNPSPEHDSVVEHLQYLVARGVAVDRIAALFTLTRELIASNQRERGIHESFAGEFDDLALRMRHQALNGGTGRSGQTTQALARALRPALTVLRDPSGHTAGSVMRASVTVNTILDTIPAARLFTASMRHELRAANYGLLKDLADQRQAPEGVAA